MTRRISLPGADELFRKTTLSAVPDQSVEEVEVSHTNRPTTAPEELFDLEQARLHLRGDLGLAVDRGRIVRESLAIVIADLEAKGDQSIIARRLRGR